MATIRVILGGIVGSILGWCAAHLLNYVGLGANENYPSWMAAIFGINGAIVSKFGWEYWIALGIDAADLSEPKPSDKSSN
jgi:hypothetical protein